MGGIPHYVKDLHPYHNVNTSEEDSNGTSSERGQSVSCMMTKMWSQTTFSRSDSKQNPLPCLCEKASIKNSYCQAATFVIMILKWDVVREMTYHRVQSEREHVLHAECRQEEHYCFWRCNL